MTALRRLTTLTDRMVVTEDEHELVLRSREGDSRAFAALIKAHQRMIHSLLFRMTGSLADAEDVAQETFIQAHQHLAQFQGDALAPCQR
jgi:RNA polymerase sigma-70 factor (ECF subfamily)